MGEVSTVGLDLAKLVFQAHGADASGTVVFRKKLRRDQMLSFFAGLPRCVVAMEACAGAHHWARELAALVDYVMDPASDLLPETRSVLKVLAEALQQLGERIALWPRRQPQRPSGAAATSPPGWGSRRCSTPAGQGAAGPRLKDG